MTNEQVKWLKEDKGLCLTNQEKGKDFLPHSSATQSEGLKTLEEVKKVKLQFKKVQGGPQAVNITKE